MIDGKTPWDWQIEAVNKLYEYGKGIVEAAPGSGKTAVGIMAIEKLWSHKTSALLSVLILVPTNELKKQWIFEIEKNVPKMSNVIKLETYAMMGKYLKDKEYPEVDLLIMDELHRTHSPVYANVHKIKAKYTLGLTATPSRECIEKLGKVLVKIDWDDAHLSNFTLNFLGIQLKDKERALYDKFTEHITKLYRQYNRNEQELLMWSLRRRDIVHKAQEKIECALQVVLNNTDKRMMVFGERINQIEKVAKVLDEKKIPYAIMHSDREDRFDEYMAGKINILLSSRMLREGFNDPTAEVGVIMSFPLTKTTHVQTIGRLVRYMTGKNAQIYYIVANGTTDEKIIKEARRSCGWERVRVNLNYYYDVTVDKLFE